MQLIYTIVALVLNKNYLSFSKEFYIILNERDFSQNKPRISKKKKNALKQLPEKKKKLFCQ